MATIVGTNGNNILVGTTVGDTMIGGAGNDQLFGNGGMTASLAALKTTC